VPALSVVARIGSPLFSVIFQIALFITLIKSGVGLLHALNERLATEFSNRGSRMPQRIRPLTSLVILAFALFLANRVGIVALVARGYGTVTYGFLVVYVLPVMTLGLWRIWHGTKATAPSPISGPD
jgi:uncharacterized membrane protein YkvI